MRRDDAAQRPSHFRRIVGSLIVLATMLLQPSGPAWAVDRLTAGQSWYVLNETGIDNLGVQRLRITGPDAGAFAIEGYTGSPAGMVPSQDVFTTSLVQKTPSTPLGVNLRFTPQHSGDHQASLEVTHDGSNASPAAYPLKGAGAWDVAAQASTNTIDFGEQAMGMPAMTQDAFVRAVGAHGWLKVTGVKLEGSSDFTLAQIGLANKGSATWGTGANLEVLPAGATESTKTFTAADVSVGGLTDGAMRVRYRPTLRGPQAGTLTVYHDGPGGQTSLAVAADGLRGTSVEVTGSFPTSATTAVTNFARVGVNSAAQTKTVYLKATGQYGRVTYSGLKVENATDIIVTSIYLVGEGGKHTSGNYICGVANVVSTTGVAAPSGSDGLQEASFSLVGTDVGTPCTAQGPSTAGRTYPHLAVVLKYTPKTIGQQSAKITVYHDGNDEGNSSFEISGEAFRDVNVEVTGSFPASATTAVTDFARAGVNSAAQTKTVYLKATGTYGQVTYSGLRIEGSSDIIATSVYLVGQGGKHTSGNYLCGIANIVSTTTIAAPGSLDEHQEASFSLVGTNVNTPCTVQGPRTAGQTYPHLAVVLKYTPNTAGLQTAKVTLFHDGDVQGFTEFEVSGEAYSNVVLTASESANATVVPPSSMPDAYVGLPVTKSIYLRASGPNGAVTYQGVDVSGTPDARIVGAYSVVKGGSTTSGANLVQTPGASVAFQQKGADVSTSGYTDLRVDVEFTPKQAGSGQLDLTFHHNAPRLTTQVSLNTTAEDLGDRIVIQNNGVFRNWSNNTFAASCEEYRRPAQEDRVYAGDIGSGMYRINVAAGPLDVFCDMDSDGGGWTRVVQQFEATPVTTWTGGVNGASYVLSAAQIPAHTQVGFGKDDLASDVDFVDWTYTTGDIEPPVLVVSPRTGLSYQVHRRANAYYSYHNPEEGMGLNGVWNNTLTFDRTGVRGLTWAFSPQQTVVGSRGYSYAGTVLDPSPQSFAWTVWVR